MAQRCFKLVEYAILSDRRELFKVKLFAIFLLFAAMTPAVHAQNANPAPTPPASPASPALSPEELANKYLELWNTGNFDLINSIFVFPVIMSSEGNRTRIDADTLKRVITAWRHSMPDLNFKVQDTITQGQKVVMRLVFTGSYKERLFPNTADPKDHERGVRATAIWIMEARDGKIREIWEEYDQVRMRYEMGGFWRSDQELNAMSKKSATSKKASPSATEPSPKP
jgi:steroid delta-isomerase-like uncharacterized protein